MADYPQPPSYYPEEISKPSSSPFPPISDFPSDTPPEYNGKKRLYLQGPPTHGATWIRKRETHIIPPPAPIAVPAPPPPPPFVELPPPPPPPPVIIPVHPPPPIKEPDVIDVIAVDVEPRRKRKSSRKPRSRSRSERREEVYIERERLVPVPVPVPVRERREEYETYRYVEGPKRLPAPPSPVRRPPWEEDREVGVHVRVSEREREREVSGESDRGGYRRERDYY